MSKFKIYRQTNEFDCGPTCLQMVADYYGKYYSVEMISKEMVFNKNGTSFKDISDAARKIGFEVNGVKVTYDQLVNQCRFPCILHWKNRHFVVMVSHHPENDIDFFKIADPAIGLLYLVKEKVIKNWLAGKEKDAGYVLLLNPAPGFYQ